jgi:high affinity Mn2+ porin
LLGVEADMTFPNYLTSNSVVSSLATPRSDVTEQWDYVGTVRGRIGYATGPWLVYATGGLAWAGERFINTPAIGNDEKKLNLRLGWAAGGGVEYAFAPHWSLRLEYLYSQFEKADITFPSATQYTSSLDFQSLRVGINRKIDWPGSSGSSPNAPLTEPESDRWEIHGQTTYLPQGYPAFRAPYSGPNSLTPAPQIQATWSNSLYLNVRLWEGGEVYYNPELLQGFGLNDTVGAGGFPSGEAQKSNFAFPHYNTSRLFLRQTFGFGGEQEELASGSLQLANKVDVSRFTLQAGKFSVTDVFDGNSYARDPRKDFMNWSLWSSGAFDYAATSSGLDTELRRSSTRSNGHCDQAISSWTQCRTRTTSIPKYFSAAVTWLNWRRAIRCFHSRESCEPSRGSTAPIPEATARHSTIRRSISISRKPAPAASNMVM